jgi:predicted metal-dependent enzyme (double-stranded beta helix superfamily)
LWNPSTISIEVINLSAQGIHVVINNMVTRYCFTATFVYGYNIISARRALWKI